MAHINLGIIGIGNMGSGHAKNISSGRCPEIRIAAIADNNPERLAWAKEQGYGDDIAFFDNAIDMLDSGKIDACIVCVPHYDHPTFAIECMKRSIHIMVEKPAGVYTKQVLEMNRVADEHPEVKFGLMFNQRTNCVYRKMREMIQSGDFGQIRRVNWLITTWFRTQAYYDSGSWRATWSGEGGGVLLNQCPHQLDLMQWICGMPKKVNTKLLYGAWHDIEVEDDVTAVLEYENGATGVFITSTGDIAGTNRFEVQTDKAKFVVENDILTVEEYAVSAPEHTKTCTGGFAKPEITKYEPETDGENPQHIGVLNAWANAILHGGDLIADGREGINEVRLSNAMHLSAFLGKEVEIGFDDDLYFEELSKRIAASKAKEGQSTFLDTDAVLGSTKS